MPGRTSHYWIWSDPRISYNNTVWLENSACIQLIVPEKRDYIFFNLSKTHLLTYSNAWEYIRSPETAAFPFKTHVPICSCEGMHCFGFCVTSTCTFQLFAILTLTAYRTALEWDIQRVFIEIIKKITLCTAVWKGWCINALTKHVILCSLSSSHFLA